MSQNPIDEQTAMAEMQTANDLATLNAIELRLFGRKQGILTAQLRALKELTDEERRTQGGVLNALKSRLEEALAQRRLELKGAQNQAEAAQLDVTIEVPERREYGHLHLIPSFIETIEDVFGRMGFDVAEGPEIETEAYQFDLLNFPKQHAARDAQAIFYIDEQGDAENRRLLRGHTSTVQIRYMQDHTPPFRMICPGRVYRKDADATHSPMFHQFEGLMVGPDVSLASMKAVMVHAMKELIGDDLEFRFRTSYFPFVEPGLEVDMRQRSTDGTGRWLEVVGCGMVHPNVLRAGGIDPSTYRGFAFGFGIERLLMIKHDIRDLRAFYENDLRFLRQW